MNLYCATHKNEDLNALHGEPLDAMTMHMVVHKSYDLNVISCISPIYVIWEMVKRPDGYFYFNRVVDRA